MTSAPDALKVFWPSHLCQPNSRPGYLIGWQNAPFTFCVAAIVHDMKIKDLQQLIQEFCTFDDAATATTATATTTTTAAATVTQNSNYKLIHRVCKARPTLLGQLATKDTRPSHIHPIGVDAWLTMYLDEAYVPVPISLSKADKAIDLTSYQILFYEQPNPERLQFLALEPLALDITPKQHQQRQQRQQQEQQQYHRQANQPSVSRVSSKSGSSQQQRQTALTLQNLAKHIVNGQQILGIQEMDTSDDLTSVLVQINSSYYLEHGIQSSCLFRRKQQQQEQEQQQQAQRRRTYLDACHDGIKHMQTFIYHTILLSMIVEPVKQLWALLQRIFMGPWLCLVFVFLMLAEITLHILSIRLPKIHVALKDLSVAGQQIDLRLQQLYFWPRQYMMLRKRNWANTAETRAYYISFYNSMWLVANDIIIGVAIGSYLMGNRHIVSNKLHDVLKTYTVDSLQSMMYWFLETPAGLKLNTELGTFLSELFLWLIHLWTECMAVMQPWTPRIIYLIGGSGIFGVSMIIALLSDMLACLTMQIYCFYMVAARIFNWQLITLYALFNLFRGKKRNMLRNRIDSCDYDLDQLLLGTCLFTLLTFLFPTVLIYYLTFALSRVCVIFLQAIMETMLAFFNHFPLFAIMLRIKDPDRVPGGLRFDLFQQDTFLYKHHWLRQTWNRWKTQQHQDGNGDSAPPISSSSSSSTLATSVSNRQKRKLVRFQLPNERQYQGRKHRQQLLQQQKHTSHQQEQHTQLMGTYLWIKNTPIPFGAIFFQYMLLWKRLSAHYFSTYVFQCFLYGEPIRPIPKLQYPMLPDNRIPLKTAWKMLKTMWNNS